MRARLRGRAGGGAGGSALCPWAVSSGSVQSRAGRLLCSLAQPVMG